MRQHNYSAAVEWTGNDGAGTQTYKSYRRDYTIQCPGKREIEGSSDPDFRGDASRYNPEELLVASIASCHMLWYLHLCSANGISVQSYRDQARGTMEESSDGAGAFVGVELRPVVTIAAGNDASRAMSLHEEAHRMCFIARSVRFPVDLVPEIHGSGGAIVCREPGSQ